MKNKSFILLISLLIVSVSLSSCLNNKEVSTIEQYENMSADEWNYGDGIVLENNDSLYLNYPDFLIAPKNNGKHIFVSKNGSNSNPGTFSLPIKSISTALSIAKKGDIIYIREGVYSESIQIACQGDKTNWITISSYPNEKVIYDGQNKYDYAFSIKNNSKYIQISGLELINYNLYGISIDSNASDISIKEMTIHNIGCDALSSSGYAGIIGEGKNIIIDNCEIFDISQQRLSDIDHGIYLTTSENYLISRCNIYNCPGGGIHIYCGGIAEPKSTNIYVQNNIIENCKYGMVMSSCNKVYVSNNDFVNMYNSYFFVLDYVSDSIIQNNVLINHHRVGDIYYEGDYNNNRIKRRGITSSIVTCNNANLIYDNVFSHNIIWQEFEMRFVLPPLYETVDTIFENDTKNKYESILITDPQLSSEYKPNTGSPCIAAGISNDYSPKINHEGDSRKSINIGAF